MATACSKFPRQASKACRACSAENPNSTARGRLIRMASWMSPGIEGTCSRLGRSVRQPSSRLSIHGGLNVETSKSNVWLIPITCGILGVHFNNQQGKVHLVEGKTQQSRLLRVQASKKSLALLEAFENVLKTWIKYKASAFLRCPIWNVKT